MKEQKAKPCIWYSCCPIRTYTDQGKLERIWVENYCLAGDKSCVRYQMESKGKAHPDNMLPNGEIRKELR